MRVLVIVSCVHFMFMTLVLGFHACSAECISRWLRLLALRGQPTFFWETLYLCEARYAVFTMSSTSTTLRVL